MWMLYVFLCVFLFSLQSILLKTYQKKVPPTGLSQLLYLLLVSAEASVVFFILAGGNVFHDPFAIRFGALASLVIMGSLFFNLVGMSHLNLAVLTVSQNAGALVLPALYGFLVLGEPMTLPKALGLLLVMAAFFTSFIFRERRAEGRSDRAGILIAAAVFLCSGGGNILNKAYTASEAVASNQVYLTWLNVFMVPVLLIALGVMRFRAGKPFREMAQGISFKYYLLVAGGVVIGCLGMVSAMTALSMVDVSLYSPLYASLFIIFITVVSRVVFREKLTRANYISVGLAVAAVILSVL